MSRTILFDGFCNLCSGIVIFIIKKDPQGKIKFASLQSGKGRKFLKGVGLPDDQINFIVYLRDGNVYIKSTAVLMVLKDLGGIWKLFYLLIIIPRFIRDYFYGFIANRRYRLFGRKELCMIPPPEFNERFLE